MLQDDIVRLRHMVDAAREAVASAEARSRGDLDHDRVWAFGLVKCIEIVGEVAARISDSAKAEHPDIPWRQVVAMRNRLVHVYFDIDLDQVWQTVQADLPALLSLLERALPGQSQNP